MSKAHSYPLDRGHFETWTNRPEIELCQVTQVHGTDIASVETLPAEADGVIASWEELKDMLAIKTADCMPIVIEGESGVVFLHAGWRGLKDGILKRPEVSLIAPKRAYIGPSIHKCCFEVSQDFRENFPGSPFFEERAGKLYFDLQAQAIQELRSYTGISITDSKICTCCNDRFHSYRRDKPNQRNWNLYIKG